MAALRPRTVPLLLLAALLLGAAATVIALGGDEAPQVGAVRVDDAEADAPPVPADLMVADAASESAVAPNEPGDGRQEVIAYPTEVGGQRLRVVEASSRRPVPFAEVFVGDAGDQWRGRRRDADVAHWAQLLERDAVVRQADAQGEVGLPPMRRRLLIAGRAAGLFGVLVVTDAKAEPVLELHPDAMLRARVRDDAGEVVAGVRVALGADLGESVRPVAHAVTGSDGIAVLPHVQLFATRVPPRDAEAERQLAERAQSMRARVTELQDRLRADGRLDAQLVARMHEQQVAFVEAMRAQDVNERMQRARDAERRGVVGQPAAEAATWPIADFVLVAVVPSAQPAHARVPANPIPKEIVELRLPALGALDVRVVGPDGADLLSPCRVTARVADTRRLPDARLRSIDGFCAASGEKALGAHLVRLEPLGLGLTLRVEVEFADDDFNFAVDDVVGPSAVGVHEVVVRAPGWFSTVVGRALDAQRVPLAGIEADLFVAGAKGRVEGERVEFGADGHFELPVRLREPTPPYTLEIQARVGDRRIGKLVTMPHVESGGRVDLGEITMTDLAALATGTVRDDRGQALRGVDVVAQVLRGDAWTEESFVRASTDAEGAFALFGEPRTLPMRLRARARGHAPAEVDVAFGARVDLTLARNGAIRAEGFVPEFLGREAMIARLVDVATGEGRDVGVRRPQPDRFELRLNDLRPGQWRLSLQVRGLLRPLAFAEYIVVPPGETARPPTLDGLDLRGRIFQFVIQARDASGQPMRDPGSPLMVQLHDATGGPQYVPFVWRGSRIELIADQPSVQVVGLATGHRPARALLQAGEGTLTFARIHPLHLTLPGLRALLGPEQSARISLVLDGATGLPETDLQAIEQSNGRTRGFQRASLGKSGGAGLGAGDEVSVGLIFNGRYEVVLRIDGPGGRVSKTLGFVQAVLDGAEPPRALLAPDAGVVRAALDELRARQPLDRGRRGR